VSLGIGAQKPAITTRAAQPSDKAAVVRTLARAFQTESAFSYILPDSDNRARRLLKVFEVLATQDLRVGKVFMTTGGEAITMWRTPDHLLDGLWFEFRMGIPFLRAFGGGLGRALKTAGLIKKHFPKELCWYLHFAGCDPDHQGKGMGGAAIRAGLAAADTEGAKAYLETADEKNLAIYRALGFEVIKTWIVPDGPQFWGMMRSSQR
jgi:ribosomal protein S18 acetylase RimI-like enzyme